MCSEKWKISDLQNLCNTQWFEMIQLNHKYLLLIDTIATTDRIKYRREKVSQTTGIG